MTSPDQPAAAPTLAALDERLAWARADLAEWQRVHDRLEATRRALAAGHATLARRAEADARERRDVDLVEGLGLSSLLEALFGDLEARRDKELHEWLAARLRHEEARRRQESLAADLAALERRVASLADPREDYHRLLAEKSTWLARHPADTAERRLHLAERQGVLVDALREFDEALWAGEVARAALTGVLHALSKAQALGKLDMIGLSSNWVKFEHIDDAHRHASAANRALSRFQRELTDVQAHHDAHLTMEIGQLATFADYFLDDLVSDWVVQCRITRSHHSAAIALARVNRTLRWLATRRAALAAELGAVKDQRRDLSRPVA